MKLLLFIALLAPFVSVAKAEEWNLIWVTSDHEWHTSEAQGTLDRKGDHLSGVFHDKQLKHITYNVEITLKEASASALFKVSPQVEEAPESLSGTYRRLKNAGRLGCVEEIQLINEYEYVGLFREFKCIP
jgi:hypothetical protein